MWFVIPREGSRSWQIKFAFGSFNEHTSSEDIWMFNIKVFSCLRKLYGLIRCRLQFIISLIWKTTAYVRYLSRVNPPSYYDLVTSRGAVEYVSVGGRGPAGAINRAVCRASYLRPIDCRKPAMWTNRPRDPYQPPRTMASRNPREERKSMPG